MTAVATNGTLVYSAAEAVGANVRTVGYGRCTANAGLTCVIVACAFRLGLIGRLE